MWKITWRSSIQYPHFTDEETKTQSIQFPFSRTPSSLGGQSELGPAKTNSLLNKTNFRSITVSLASIPSCVLMFPIGAELIEKRGLFPSLRVDFQAQV